ncbi:MAG: hypothetical protein P8X52_03690 [Limibacillus sp.]
MPADLTSFTLRLLSGALLATLAFSPKAQAETALERGQYLPFRASSLPTSRTSRPM